MKNILVIGGVVIVLGAIMWYFARPKSAYGDLDSFAQCLASHEVTMYGAEWCSHCQNEKKWFGKSFRYVPYVECPDNPKRCLEKGVEGYPTWILPDGTRLEGEQGPERLSAISGCALPKF